MVLVIDISVCLFVLHTYVLIVGALYVNACVRVARAHTNLIQSAECHVTDPVQESHSILCGPRKAQPHGAEDVHDLAAGQESRRQPQRLDEVRVDVGWVSHRKYYCWSTWNDSSVSCRQRFISLFIYYYSS